MTGKQIQSLVDANNKRIRNLMTPNMFLLNNAVQKLIEENKKLQEQCPHSFEDGYCNYCYKEQSSMEDNT